MNNGNNGRFLRIGNKSKQAVKYLSVAVKVVVVYVSIC